MSRDQQQDAFCNELDALVERFRQEFDLDFAAVIAALEFKKHALLSEASRRSGELP